MEGKDRNKKEWSSLPLFILFTLLSIASLLPICLHSLPPHSGYSPTTQDPVFALNEQYSTGQSNPNGKHQWNGTVGNRWRQKSTPQALQDLDNGKHPGHGQGFPWMAWRSAPPKPWPWSSESNECLCATTEPQEQSDLWNAEEGTWSLSSFDKAIRCCWNAWTTCRTWTQRDEGTWWHHPEHSQFPEHSSPQNIPNPQSIPSPPIPEHPIPLPQISFTLPPTMTRADQERAEQRMGTDINANRLTMNEALRLFELLQERRAREAHQPSTIVTHPVEVVSRGTYGAKTLQQGVTPTICYDWLKYF